VKTGSKMGYENDEEYGSGNMIDDLIRFSVQIGMVNASSNYVLGRGSVWKFGI
jgi:hypothetical protein